MRWSESAIPKSTPKPKPHSDYSQLACDAFELIRRDGPISKQKMRDVLGGSVSFVALDHALGELWSKLRITRVDYNPTEGAFWDVLYRWSPDAVREGVNLSVGESLSALLTKYLDCVVAADQQELESFFGNFVPRSRVKEAINALLAARELSFVHVGNRTLIQITPAKAEAAPRAAGLREPRHLGKRCRLHERDAQYFSVILSVAKDLCTPTVPASCIDPSLRSG